MPLLNLIVLVVVAWLIATSAIAADETPTTLDQPAEIVVIGAGEIMDALHRAVEEEVTVINEEGGVMRQPLKVTRDAETCKHRKPKSKIAKAVAVAARRPILIFQTYCLESGLPSVAAYAERGILVMNVGEWPPELSDQRPGPTVFRLAPNHRTMQEAAFLLSTVTKDRLQLLARQNDETKKLMTELRKGFAASPDEKDQWGPLLEDTSPILNELSEPRICASKGDLCWTYDPGTTASATIFLVPRRASNTGLEYIRMFTEKGWRGVAIVPHKMQHLKADERWKDWLNRVLPREVEIHSMEKQPFYLGPPPAGAKSYTAFHPDWVAGFWQVMKAVKYAKSLDGREIAKTLGGKPFFSRAPWLMLQSRSRYVPHELRQRFNNNGDLRMAGYKLEKIWPED